MHTRARRIVIGIFASLALALGSAGCGDDADGGVDTTDPGAGGSSVVPWTDAEGERVGAGGGNIAIGGDGAWSTAEGTAASASSSHDGEGITRPERPPLIALEIPPGALEDDVEISVSYRRPAADDPLRPEGYRLDSPLFQFSPEGLTFNEPITVRIRASGASSDATIYWSLPGDRTSFATLEGAEREGGVLVGQVTHFSRAFAGVPCTPECSDRECGADGCGGVCGVCSDGERCRLGICEEIVTGTTGISPGTASTSTRSTMPGDPATDPVSSPDFTASEAPSESTVPPSEE